MTPEQLKAAIERRGYFVREIKDVTRPADIVVFLISRGAQWMEYSFVVQDIADVRLSVRDYTEHVLKRLSGGMEHVWCKNCYAPLLKHTDQPLALRLLHTGTKPRLSLKVDPAGQVHVVSSGSAEESIERASVYFDARIGLASPMLEYCPKCGHHLDNNAVEEVQDAN